MAARPTRHIVTALGIAVAILGAVAVPHGIAESGAASGDAPLVGRGWDEGDWEAPPTRAALDALAPTRPVLLHRHDFHTLWVNSAALAAVGVTAAAADWAATTSGRNRSYLPLMMGALGAGATVGYLLPMSRTQEAEADRIGLVLMAMAGYDPREAVGLWERMRAASRGKSKPPEWLSTHPSDDTRIANIRAALPEAMKYYRPRND